MKIKIEIYCQKNTCTNKSINAKKKNHDNMEIVT